MSKRLAVTAAALLLGILNANAADERIEYKILATSKTSTMEKEMNEAAAAGYRFSSVMGGESAVGGKEVVVAMAKPLGSAGGAPRNYKLLATSKTSTMQKEMQQLADEGFEYLGQTIFESAFGGKEVTVIMERDPSKRGHSIYRLLATSKTSTMEKELKQAGDEGFQLMGLTVAKTALGGSELLCILRKN